MIKRYLPGALLLVSFLVAYVFGHAENTKLVAEAQPPAESASRAVTVETGTTTEAVDIDALLSACAACHGADGNSSAAIYPKLAGQNFRYLLKQLNDIQRGERDIPAMVGQLDNMSEDQLRAIASYYSAQTMSLNQAQEVDLALGEKIYRLGNLDKNLPACSGCHSPLGDGNAPAGFPVLGGQHSAYIVSTLKAFREGAQYETKGRRNDEMQGVMRSIALRMSDREIEAVANYISGLHKE